MLASASLLLCCCWFRCRFCLHFSPSIVGVILIESDLFMANIEISGHDAQVNWIRRIHDFPYQVPNLCFNMSQHSRSAANVRNGETDQTIPPYPTCAVAKDESFSTQDASKWSHFQHIHRSKILKYQMQISDSAEHLVQLNPPTWTCWAFITTSISQKIGPLPVPRGLCSPVWPTWWLSERPPGKNRSQPSGR